MGIHLKLKEVQSKLVAPKNQNNKFGGYKYRSCEDILQAVKPLLNEQCLCITISDSIEQVADRVYVRATVSIHDEKSGDTISVKAYARETENRKGMDASQITGSASSYARKYALNGLFAIDDTKDADHGDNRDKSTSKRNTRGNKAVKKTKSTKSVSDAQMKAIYAIGKSLGDMEKLKSWYKKKYSVNSSKDLTKDQASELISILKEKQEAKK